MKKKNYWTKEEEELVIEINNCNNIIVKNKLIKKIIPKINKMIHSIGRRYYGGAIPQWDEERIYLEVLTHVITNLDKFNKVKGSSYSFIGTMIKRELYSEIVRPSASDRDFREAMRNTKADMFDDNEDCNYQFIYNDPNIEDFDIKNTIEIVKDKLIEKIVEIKKTKTKYKRDETRISTHVELIKAMIKVLDETDILVYECFIINVAEELNTRPDNLIRWFSQIGFNTDGLFSICKDYTGKYVYKINKPTQGGDWMFDKTPMQNEYVKYAKFKNYYIPKKKRNK